MNQPAPARLLLDEMFSLVIAAALRDLKHDVTAVAEQPGVRAMTDEEIVAFAASQGRRLLTENVKDFQPILQQALQGSTPPSAFSLPAAAHSPGPAGIQGR
jgi:predicted nuclease of predicted toxin-antitoxin system